MNIEDLQDDIEYYSMEENPNYELISDLEKLEELYNIDKEDAKAQQSYINEHYNIQKINIL